MALQFNGNRVEDVNYNSQAVNRLLQNGEVVWVRGAFVPWEDDPDYDLLGGSGGASPTIFYPATGSLEYKYDVPTGIDAYWAIANNTLPGPLPISGEFTTTYVNTGTTHETYQLSRMVDINNFIGVTLWDNGIHIWQRVNGTWNNLYQAAHPAIGTRVQLIWHSDTEIELLLDGISQVTVTTAMTSGNFGTLLRGHPSADMVFSDLSWGVPAIQPLNAPVLSIASTGDGTIDVTVTDPNTSPNEAVVAFYYRVQGDATWVEASQEAADTTSYQYTGLTNGTTYEVMARAIGDGTNTSDSPDSNIESGTPESTPTAELNFTINIATAGELFRMPFQGNVNVTINWGDGNPDEPFTSDNPEHTYDTTGEFTVTATGSADAFSYKNQAGSLLLTRVNSFGITINSSLSETFDSCDNLIEFIGTGAQVSTVTTIYKMLSNCDALTRIEMIDWDLSICSDASYFAFRSALVTVVDMTGTTFTNALLDTSSAFSEMDVLQYLVNPDMDTSGVTNMNKMFFMDAQLICMTRLDTTTAAVSTYTTQDMFGGCDSLVQPDESTQDELQDVGINWTNPGTCP